VKLRRAMVTKSSAGEWETLDGRWNIYRPTWVEKKGKGRTWMIEIGFSSKAETERADYRFLLANGLANATFKTRKEACAALEEALS
jgi:hypothetical protein